MMTFTVYANMVQEVAKRLDRLAKKAAGYEIPFSYAVSEEHPQEVAVRKVDPATQTIQTVSTYTVAAVGFEVECDGLIKADGWTVCAKIEHGDKGNIVTGFGDHAVRPEWYTAAPNCDHCHINRFRSVTFICENDKGEYKQVGRTCLKDYTGISPATAAMWAEVQDLIDHGMDCTAEEWESHSSEKMYDLTSVLAHASDAIGEFGYRKSSEPGSTREQVMKRMMDCKNPSEAGLVEAQEVIDWLTGRSKKVASEDAELSELWDKYCADGDDGDERYWGRFREINNAWDAVSDLERNCIPLALSGYTKANNVGRLAYMPVAYKKYQERMKREEDREAARKAVAETSAYVGGIGERLLVKLATAELITSWDGMYGTTWLYRFTDESGNVFIWYASRPCDAEGGATIKATVKDHKERNGVKQTILTRCQVAA